MACMCDMHIIVYLEKLNNIIYTADSVELYNPQKSQLTDCKVEFQSEPYNRLVITKTRLFKYIENFTTQKWQFFRFDWFWLCWGLTTRQPLRVILCRLPEKGRKEIEERVEEMKERDREERGTGMKVKKQKK